MLHTKLLQYQKLDIHKLQNKLKAAKIVTTLALKGTLFCVCRSRYVGSRFASLLFFDIL